MSNGPKTVWLAIVFCFVKNFLNGEKRRVHLYCYAHILKQPRLSPNRVFVLCSNLPCLCLIVIFYNLLVRFVTFHLACVAGARRGKGRGKSGPLALRARFSRFSRIPLPLLAPATQATFHPAEITLSTKKLNLRLFSVFN